MNQATNFTNIKDWAHEKNSMNKITGIILISCGLIILWAGYSSIWEKMALIHILFSCSAGLYAIIVGVKYLIEGSKGFYEVKVRRNE